MKDWEIKDLKRLEEGFGRIAVNAMGVKRSYKKVLPKGFPSEVQ